MGIHILKLVSLAANDVLLNCYPDSRLIRRIMPSSQSKTIHQKSVHNEIMNEAIIKAIIGH